MDSETVLVFLPNREDCYERLRRARFGATVARVHCGSDEMSRFGGVLSFELDCDFAGMQSFLGALDEFSLAVSLGGVKSLIEHPASMTHEPILHETRLANGVTDTLLRVLVGIEYPDDLLIDLERGFANV